MQPVNLQQILKNSQLRFKFNYNILLVSQIHILFY